VRGARLRISRSDLTAAIRATGAGMTAQKENRSAGFPKEHPHAFFFIAHSLNLKEADMQVVRVYPILVIPGPNQPPFTKKRSRESL